MNKFNKKILIILPTLRRGGAERFTVNLFNELKSNGVDVKLVICGKKEGYSDEIAFKDSIIYLNKNRFLNSILLLHKVISDEKPDIVLSMFAHVNSVLISFKLIFSFKFELYLREVNLIEKTIDGYGFFYKKLLLFQYRYLYRKFVKLIICQSSSMQESLAKKTSVNSIVINNGVNVSNVISMSKLKDNDMPFLNGKYNILFVGRISEQKGIDILLETASLLDNRFCIFIYGAGDGVSSLKNKLNEEAFSNVYFKGQVSNPYNLMANTDRLIMSSRYEGFPNVAIEALLLGTPIIRTPFKGGEREIFSPLNSVTAESFSAPDLAKAIFESFSTTYQKNTISQETSKKFDMKNIAKLYLEAFK
ncbi:glycosyltransferase [Vibrio parahaemolyticus]|nr:glycosyltransferase [Vibrio parahaemolyticus]ELB2164208.1 glycosyltransferase [Vibrio parahaemolyticus]ELB2188087.1 glycosyltransferase [Vibrio parahaemolyticus]ELB2191309.1 glycosyltransferase [Vibrio parahaemolyticus]ELB2211913.1 glycosyltransferase [Vibrio parahaemolyticus]